MEENRKLWQEMGFKTATLGYHVIGTAGDIAREFFYTFTVEKCGLAADIDWNLANLEYFINEGIPNVAFVAPDSAQKEQLDTFADLFTYMDENIQKFMMGTRDMNEWESFIAECQSMGIDDATAVRQDLFDAYVAIMDSMGAPVFTH